jgi:hypothetical protein
MPKSCGFTLSQQNKSATNSQLGKAVGNVLT